MKPVIYVVANKSLGMSPGKLAAQVGHAIMGLTANTTNGSWMREPQRWVIVLEADNGEQLHHLREYLETRLVPHYAVIDEGVNEIPPFSLTAVAVGILDKDSREAAHLAGLKKYSHSFNLADYADDDYFNPIDYVSDRYLSREGRHFKHGTKPWITAGW